LFTEKAVSARYRCDELKRVAEKLGFTIIQRIPPDTSVPIKHPPPVPLKVWSCDERRDGDVILAVWYRLDRNIVTLEGENIRYELS